MKAYTAREPWQKTMGLTPEKKAAAPKAPPKPPAEAAEPLASVEAAPPPEPAAAAPVEPKKTATPAAPAAKPLLPPEQHEKIALAAHRGNTNALRGLKGEDAKLVLPSGRPRR